MLIDPIHIDNEASEKDIEKFREHVKRMYMLIINNLIKDCMKDGVMTYRKLSRIRKASAFKLLKEVRN